MDASNLGLLIECPTHWTENPRWRITVAVEGKSPWRAQLPLFDGGVQLFVSSVETVVGTDVSLTIVPRDPARAALVKSMDTLDASNVDKLFEWLNLRPENGFASDGDPWTRAAAFVLLTRVGRIAEAGSSPSAVAREFPWLADLAVVAAWSVAATSSESDYESECLKLLAEADRRGAPAFVASASLATEMLRTLATTSESDRVKQDATAALKEWARHARFLVRSGPFLSWERRDIELPPERMSAKDYYVVARGNVHKGRIDPEEQQEPAVPAVLTHLAVPPALGLPVTHSDDPHKGRFGGRSRVENFELSATFRSTFSRWVEITCVIRAHDEQPPVADDLVEFFLHPTFSPDRIVVKFVGDTARFSVLAYGGFTVGAWIPSRHVQLELDLSEAPGAPQVIREL
jgi:hypothetical protein